MDMAWMDALPEELVQAVIVALAAFIGTVSKDIRLALKRWFGHKADEAASDIEQDEHVRTMNLQHLAMIERLVEANARERHAEHESLQSMMTELVRVQRECYQHISDIKTILSGQE